MLGVDGCGWMYHELLDSPFLLLDSILMTLRSTFRYSPLDARTPFDVCRMEWLAVLTADTD